MTDRAEDSRREGGRGSGAWVGAQKRFITLRGGGLIGKRRGSGALIGPAAGALGETGPLRKSRFAHLSFFLSRHR